MSHPAVSAIIVSYKTGPRLKECLYALISDPDVDEIIVVDNGNPDADFEWLQEFADQRVTVQLITGHGNIGFGAGINLGMRAAAGPHLLVINPDAVLRRKSVASLQSVARDRRVPWIIGGKIFDLHGREERGPRRRELTLWRAVTSLLGWNTWTLEHTPAPESAVGMPVISGAFFLTSEASMAQLNGFDEAYFLHVEDVDLCRRCREAGGEVLYDPHAAALHYGSTSDATRDSVNRHKADSLALYFRKFAKSPIEWICAALATSVIHLAARLRR